MAEGTEPANLVASPAIDSAREVFLAWERLRLAYNAALAVVVLLFVVLLFGTSDLSDPAFRGFVARAMIGANLCFCVGPLAEGYLALLFGADRRVVRWLVFVPGLLFACILAYGALFSWHMRGFD